MCGLGVTYQQHNQFRHATVFSRAFPLFMLTHTYPDLVIFHYRKKKKKGKKRIVIFISCAGSVFLKDVYISHGGRCSPHSPCPASDRRYFSLVRQYRPPPLSGAEIISWSCSDLNLTLVLCTEGTIPLGRY